MRETSAWTALKTALGSVFHMERFTDRFNEGVADVNWLHKATGREGWVELKVIHGELERPDLKQHQALWLRKRASYNGRAGVLVAVAVGARPLWRYYPAEGSMEWVRAMMENRARYVALTSLEHLGPVLLDG